jgi:hypothetical protein
MARFNASELREYVQVHRGLNEVGPEHISPSRLGVHWTTDRGVASDFANYGVYMEANDEDNFMSAYSAEDSHGTVLTGKIHVSDIINPHDPNYNFLRQKLGIFYPGHRERELTLRPEATVKDVAAHHYENGKLVRSVFLGDRKTYPDSYVKGLI